MSCGHALYQAIGEPNNRYRRPLPAGRISEPLMVTHFTTLPCPVRIEKLPRVTMNAGSAPAGDPFPDRLPIGIDVSGPAVLLYFLLPMARVRVPFDSSSPTRSCGGRLRNQDADADRRSPDSALR